MNEDFALYNGDRVVILPTPIWGVEDLEKIAAEMKEFERENRIDYGAQLREMLKDPKLNVEEMSEVPGKPCRVLGFNAELAKFNRYIVLGDPTKPIQLCWIVYDCPEGVLEQLSIVAYQEEILEQDLSACIASFFWDVEDDAVRESVLRTPNTPPHVAVLVRPIPRKES